MNPGHAVLNQAATARDASLTDPGDAALRARTDLLASRARLHAATAAWDEGTDEILKLKIAAALLGKEFEAYK